MNQERWLRLCASLNLSPDTATFGRLLDAYAQKHRTYHNTTHVTDCLAKLDRARHLATEPGEVEIAVWFHDAIYDPYSSKNEAESAAWARDFLNRQGAVEACADRVEAHIMATLHDGRALSDDSSLMVDIDLSILGAEVEDYQRFETAVREEYRWVPRVIYRKKRRAILESFLERERIYHHEMFREQYEDKARLNLRAAIANL